jgi:quercetin dioxygenase-like cupin family protein
MENAMTQDIASRRSTMKRNTLLCAAAGGLAIVIIAIAPLTGRSGAAASAQPVAPAAPEAKVTPLFSKDLKDFPGKEGLMITVEYPPGSVDPVHRHNAHAFLYVLEGSIVMQVKGGKEVTLKPGDTFYEGPDDVHTVGRNASNTEPAKFVVFFIKDKGAPVLVPEK